MKNIIVGLVAAFVLAGCAGKGVVGKWTYAIFGQSVVLELKDDKSFSMGSAGTSMQAGTYTFEDGKVTLKPGGGTQTITLTLAEDGKKLTGSMGPVNVEFTREGK